MRLSFEKIVKIDGIAVDLNGITDYGTMCAVILRNLGVQVPDLNLSFYPRRVEELVSKRVLLQHPSLGWNRGDPAWVKRFANGFLGRLSEETNYFENAGAEYRRQFDLK